MATKMERAGRWLNIVKRIDEHHQVTGRGMTVGEYVRVAGLGKSPYMYHEFNELVNMGILYKKQENYKSTVRNLFYVNYDNIAEFYPEIHKVITAQNGQLRLL